jgi:hypothetical protein
MSEQFQNSLQNAILLYQPHHSSGEKWRRIAFPLRALNKEWQEHELRTFISKIEFTKLTMDTR